MSLRKLKRQAMRQQVKTNENLRQEYEQSRKALTTEQRLTSLMQQGIALKQLDEEYDRGWRKGYHDAAMPTSRAAMAAAILALREVFGFGQTRCVRFLNVMFRQMVTAITDEELVREAFDKVGVEIDWGNPVDGVKTREQV